jgi:hypothetical protein
LEVLILTFGFHFFPIFCSWFSGTFFWDAMHFLRSRLCRNAFRAAPGPRLHNLCWPAGEGINKVCPLKWGYLHHISHPNGKIESV